MSDDKYFLEKIPSYISQSHKKDESSVQLNMDSTSNNSEWQALGHKFQRSAAVFAAQTLILYVVIITSLVNLTLGNEPQTLWITVLSSSLGYILPCPKIKKVVQHPLQHEPVDEETGLVPTASNDDTIGSAEEGNVRHNHQ